MKRKQIVNGVCTLSMWVFAVAGFGQVATPVAPRVAVAPEVVQASGTVTGHVYCGDTQRPARFADVELLQAADYGSRSNTNRGPSYLTAGRARTALDGSFTMVGVPAGDFYVSATMTGYISPQAVSRMTQKPISGAPMTHVDVNRSADVVITMERGAVVAGRVTYDDGAPVAGVSVRVRPLTTGSSGDTRLSFQGGFGGFAGFGSDMGSAQTDDRGAFRLVGLPAGKYSLVTTVETETTGQGRASGRSGFRGPSPTISVYAPATMHKADAQVIEIRGGETIDGVDIKVALNGLHTVQGSVVAKADGHSLNAGFVSLADASDNSSMRNAMVGTDGSFRMEYLPPGTYTLNVQGEDRTQDSGGGRRTGTSKRYERASQTITVGDHDLTVDPVQAEETKSSTTASN